MDTWIWPAFSTSLWFISRCDRRILNIMNRIHLVNITWHAKAGLESVSEDQTFTDSIFGCPIFKYVAEIWTHGLRTRVVANNEAKCCTYINSNFTDVWSQGSIWKKCNIGLMMFWRRIDECRCVNQCRSNFTGACMRHSAQHLLEVYVDLHMLVSRVSARQGSMRFCPRTYRCRTSNWFYWFHSVPISSRFIFILYHTCLRIVWEARTKWTPFCSGHF